MSGNLIDSSPQLSASQTLCSHRWNYLIVNLQTGASRTCCLTPKRNINATDIEKYGTDVFLNTEYLQQRRKEMLTGVRHSDCDACWRQEDRGLKSKRADLKEFYNHVQSRGLLPDPSVNVDDLWTQSSSQAELLTEHVPQIIEMNLGSQCDLKCTYCNYWYSSQWRIEELEWGQITEQDVAEASPLAPQAFEQTFWEFFEQADKSQLKQINIIGGEPLMSPKLDETLVKLTTLLKDQSHPDVEIGIVSNFNARPANFARFLERLKGLSKVVRVHVQPSTEALGERAEYIRQNLSWQRFHDNVHKLLGSKQELGLSLDNFYFSLMPAINLLSVSSLADFVKFGYDLSFKYDMPIGIGTNVVTDPEHHDPALLTPDFAKFTEKALYPAELMRKRQKAMGLHPNNLADCGCWEATVISLHNTLKARDFEHCKKQNHFLYFFKRNDQRRGTHFLKTFPEYCEFWQHCQRGWDLTYDSAPPIST